MKFSLRWLKEFVDIDISAHELADRLSLAGQEVEDVILQGEHLHQIITGRIEKIEKHPDADRLVITTINDGNTTHQILTAATNVFEGAIVPVSIPGSVLADGTKIKSTQMRGIDSHGMLCSEVELGVSEESAGIWILPEDTPLGIDFIEHGLLKDDILDIGILPNRGDCQSIYGMARDISALLNVPLRSPDTTVTRVKGDTGVSITLNATEQCPYYSGQLIKGITHNPTPRWMEQRLLSAGIRPISLIVDITNYVMLELGQPLHAFDFNDLSQRAIQVRLATEGETFDTLDDETRTLTTSNLLICDGDTPVALAGVMGGKNSEIRDTTADVYLEAALFEPISTRRTAVQHNLRTESAIRFEKGVDPERVAYASNRAMHLIQTLAGGEVVGELSETKHDAHPYYHSHTIDFTAEQLNTFLGSDIPATTMADIFGKLGIEVNDSFTQATVPSWRRLDMKEYPCLAEEAARIFGCDNIPVTLPTASIIVEPQTREEVVIAKAVDLMIHQGYTQTNTYPMISSQDFHAFHAAIDDSVWTIQNPISSEESLMRQSLLPSLMKVAAHNIKRQQESIKLFECAKTYFREGDQLTERMTLSALCVGPMSATMYTETDKTANDSTLFTLKHTATQLLERLTLKRLYEQPQPLPFAHPTQCVGLYSIKDTVGHVGYIHPMVAKHYDIQAPVGFMTFYIDTITTLPSGGTTYKPYSKFPSTKRDIAILTPKTLAYGDILSFLQRNKPKEATSVELFDLFESEKIGTDNRSLAVSITYHHHDKTLADDDVNQLHQSLCDALQKEFPISFR